MALVVKDRVKQTSTTTGSGSIVLNGTVAGFQTFTSALTDGDTTYYAIVEPSTGSWEVGLGTWTESTTTLARTTVLESSNSGSAINLTAGEAEVFITQPASKAVYTDASGNLNPTGNVDLGDNVRIRLGNSDDLQIYHTGSNSYIQENGTGSLIILGYDTKMTATGSATYFENTNSGYGLGEYGVKIRHITSGSTASEKLKTTSTGIDVTGNITVSGTVDGRDVAADGTKLDGIESGATADQTAQEIATAIDADATAEATLKSALGLGTAAYTASTDYATAAQGALADSAVQDLSDLSITATASEINKLDGVAGDVVGTTDTQTLTNKTITDAVFDNSFTIGSQIFYEQGTNGFSVNEDYDPSNTSTQTAYHFTSGSGRAELAFTLARTSSFTNGFGIYGDSSDNKFVLFGEAGNTNWEWRTGVGIQPLDLDGGTLRLSLSNAGTLDLPNHNGSTTGLSLGGTLVTASAAELNYVDGVTSNIQTQLNAKAAASHTHDDRYYTETEVGNFFGGTTAITGYNKTDWDTAYGWGNHASAGYLAASSYTAADVLTKIKTVDGAASGLDADLLDGTQLSAITRSGSSVALTGAVTGSTTVAADGSISITTTATSDPTLTINGDASGSATFTNLGNATLTLTIADDSHNHVISNIDGLQAALDDKLSTSGKAADSNLLDGIDSTGFARYASGGTLTNALADAAWVANYGGTTNVDHIWHDDAANAWNFNSDSSFKGTANSRVNAASFYANGNVVWNAGNDGAGSGLDADLLDGIQSKDYSRKVMETASGGVSDANYWAKIATYTITGNFNDGTFLYFFMNEESGSASSAAIVAVSVRTNNVSTGQANSVSVSILGMHQTDPFNDNAFKLIDNGSGTAIELWVQKNSAYDHISVYEHAAHMEGVSVAYNNNAAWQASEPVGTGNNVRSAGLIYRNNTVWNAGNDGSGSGLDADLLDGVQGSSFLRSDAADTASGVVTFTDRVELHEIRTNTGQEVIINAGESAGVAAAQTGELVYVNAENGLEINASPDNWSSGWAGRVTHLFDATIASFGTYIQLPQRIQHTGDTDTYMEFHGTDQWRVVTGGTERFEINNSDVTVQSALKEKYVALSGTTPSIDVDAGGAFSLTTSGNTTFTFTAFTSGISGGFILQLTSGGAHTITWPASVDWAGGTAPDAPASGETDIYVFWSRDGGTTWYGVQSIDAAA